MAQEQELKIGQGYISGYISAILGMCSFFGVLCFRYPALLTSEEFRNAYTQGFVRNLLFAALIVAYFTGTVSYALNRSKVLAWIGISSALAASLLGGARISVAPYESSPYSLGLDWFAIGFIFSMLIFIPIERAFALNKDQKILRPGWRTDLTYFFFNHLLIQFSLLFTNYFLASVVGWALNADLQGFIRAIPVWGQFVIVVILADTFQYWTHRLHHRVGFLWKFHSVHHCSKAMDWLAGSRSHLLEVFITRTMVMVPLYICGFGEAALNAYVIMVGVQAVAIHANIRINLGLLRYVLATPQFHHWHHSKDVKYMDANYAVHLPVIDMIFGTYRCPKDAYPEEYGIISGEPPPGFWRQMVHPFKKKPMPEKDAGAQ